ncbi:lipoma-preferred partner isoform X1 [Callithrix jacchus]|nr:lipoma-preferred partner isoform X5 [Callithrix jacchus]XP_035131934.1 lipoma-preferred partner isoform X5 [Callithrix jacchus]XP_035131935.1 lipoma-preferred partner isoform X5 [Callithrix jacchus]XP_035131937.1 lipoma-preferred partner isoform X5 [Callithrix jacchus]XP_035131939.1 lipoma-preferred partner isoform X5 [Callithrix jacchus]XP_054101447.1 lipoma-preferred partner isoform X5 [Callithrix jacchus]XP_054101448.1 lipoma-preferred partner isoform X5 [Callithrix jacchus]XP_05410145
MSHPSWLPPKSTGEPLGHVPARMETTHSFGNPSISVSTQQPPKKFAPVVAPKPKYNPYKQPGSEGDFLPPPPPPLDDSSALPSISGNFPPPPPLDEEAFKVQQGNPGGKTLEERRSSLDAEIDSLTSILADLECSSPYKPRPPQGSTSSTASPPVSTPVTGHKRMVIPNQPPLTATKKSTLKPQPAPQAGPISVTPIGTLKPQPQPVPASYTTASTSSRPTFNVQVKSAQPSPHYMAAPSSGQMYGSGPQGYNTQPVPVSGQCPPPSTRGGMDYAYIPPSGLQPEPGYGYTPNQGRYYEGYYAAGPGYGGRNDSDPAYGQQGHTNTWKREPGYTPPGAGNQNPAGIYPASGPKKTYITDPVSAPSAPPLQPKGGHTGSLGPSSVASSFRPEDELEHLTKKMLYDMENPPADEYFGRCARCGENVVGEGTGCTAMDQVFHVDCFTCIICNNKLRGQPFYAVEKKAYCEPCYINTLEQCNVCSKPIMERILRATGKAYHPHCFTCVMCHRSLDGIPFTVDAGGLIHCIEDFHSELSLEMDHLGLRTLPELLSEEHCGDDENHLPPLRFAFSHHGNEANWKFAPRCSVCKEPIMPAPGQEETVRIVALDRDFHVHCYRCEDCGGLLSEGDNQGCYPLDGHILCKTCNSARIRVLTAKASTDL